MIFEKWCARNYRTLSVKNTIKSFFIAHESQLGTFNYTDVGIILDSAMTFNLHYTDIIAKANRQLGIIFKISDEFRDPKSLKTLYGSLVILIHETVWKV